MSFATEPYRHPQQLILFSFQKHNDKRRRDWKVDRLQSRRRISRGEKKNSSMCCLSEGKRRAKLILEFDFHQDNESRAINVPPDTITIGIAKNTKLVESFRKSLFRAFQAHFHVAATSSELLVHQDFIVRQRQLLSVVRNVHTAVRWVDLESDNSS